MNSGKFNHKSTHSAMMQTQNKKSKGYILPAGFEVILYLIHLSNNCIQNLSLERPKNYSL